MSPSKTMAARRQMRTPGERTSGAWTGGCAIHPDGGDETDRTAGNSYTATPHNTQARDSRHLLRAKVETVDRIHRTHREPSRQKDRESAALRTSVQSSVLRPDLTSTTDLPRNR